MTQITLPMTDADEARPDAATTFDAGPAWILLLALLATIAGWIPGRTMLPNPETADATGSGCLNTVAPSTVFAGECLRYGRLPLWNPQQPFGGGPLLGNGEVGALYPTVLLNAFLPSRVAWAVSGVVLYWVAGFGAWWLAKKLGMQTAARMAAGAAYMFSGALAVWLNQPIAQTMALLPLVIAACLNLAGKPSGWRFAVLALLIGVSQLGGRPDVSAGFLIACMLSWVCLMIGQMPTLAGRRQGGLSFWVGGLLAMIAASALGLMLAGVQWVTWVEYVMDWTPQAFRSVFDPQGRDTTRTAVMFVLPAVVAIGLAFVGIGRGIGRGSISWVLLAAVAIALGLHGGSEREIARRWSLNWALMPAMLGVAVLAVAMLAAIGVGLVRVDASRICIALIASNGLVFVSWCHPGSSAGKVRSAASTPALVPPRISLLRATSQVLASTRPSVLPFGANAGDGKPPRAWIARTGQQVASGTAALLATTRPSLDPQTAAVIDSELAPEYAFLKNSEETKYLSLARSASPITGRPTVTWIDDFPDRIRLRINDGYGGWLVLAEPFAPGWKATFIWNVSSTSAGKKKEHDVEKDSLVFPAFGCLRGIPLPAGAPQQGRRGGRDFRELGPCEVLIEYQPRGFKHGWLVSLAGGLVVIMLLAGQLINERLLPAGKRKESADAERT
ncbi:MAG: hypothetical protein ABSH20_21130 [Tepidisphaeraceae bacterium]|jgi:hypothetical protein